VPTKSDLQYFPNAIVAAVYNDSIFKKTNVNKYFNKFYPQLVENMDLFLDLQDEELNAGLIQTPDIFYLSEISSKMLNEIMNQSKISILLEEANDIELALSSVACQVPVLSVKDLKSSEISGVFTSLATTPDMHTALENALNFNYNVDLSQFTLEKYLKKLKELI